MGGLDRIEPPLPVLPNAKVIRRAGAAACQLRLLQEIVDELPLSVRRRGYRLSWTFEVFCLMLARSPTWSTFVSFDFAGSGFALGLRPVSRGLLLCGVWAASSLTSGAPPFDPVISSQR